MTLKCLQCQIYPKSLTFWKNQTVPNHLFSTIMKMSFKFAVIPLLVLAKIEQLSLKVSRRNCENFTRVERSMAASKAVMSPWILISKCSRVETAVTLSSQMVAFKPHSKYQSRPRKQNNKRKNLMPLTNWWMILSLMKVRKTRRNSVHLSPFYSLRKTIYWMMLYKKKLLLSKRI